MMHKILLLLVCISFTAGCQSGDHDSDELVRAPEITYPTDVDQGLPFSDAVRVGHILYLSGSVGNIPGTLDLAEGGTLGQTRQALQNISDTLEKYGSSMDEVVRCHVMMADISEWSAMNEVYITFFPNHKPARSAFAANGLAIGARVEIECTATVQ